MKPLQQSVLDEVWNRIGEYLEMLPDDQWDKVLVPFLANMVLAEREKKTFFEARIYELERKLEKDEAINT